MYRIIFNGVADLEMQGQEVMYLIHLDDNRVQYELAGFSSPKITVLDYRRGGLLAIDQVLKTGRKEDFPSQFNIPSHVILRVNSQDIQLELHDTDELNPEFMLWVSIGYRGRLPIYDYLFKETVKLEDSGDMSLFALYRQPRTHKRMHPLHYSTFVRY